MLRDNFGTIAAEWRRLQGADRGSEVGARAGFAHDGTLRTAGSWREHVFYAGGRLSGNSNFAIPFEMHRAPRRAGVFLKHLSVAKFEAQHRVVGY